MEKVRAPSRILAGITSLPFWALLAVSLSPLYFGEAIEFDLGLLFVIVSVVILSGVAIVGKVPFK